VFGEAVVNSAEEVASRWREIKRAEKETASDVASCLSGIPAALPALMKAHRVGQRASGEGRDPSGPDGPRKALDDTFERLERALETAQRPGIGEAIGRHLFALANLARHWGLNSENLLRDAVRDFIDRFEKQDAGDPTA
jgi:uncharacterized protein YabN with tetrapyrrole methylase and pyrophosphatase domain